MKNKNQSKIIPSIIALTAGLALPLHAQITGDLGSTSVSYGGPIVVQTDATGFGASTGAGSGDDYNGSELDAAYGTVSGGNLYLFLAGDVQGGTSPNSLQIFIGGGGSTSGETTLATTISPLSNMNGSTFAPGFNGLLAFTMNDYSGTLYTDAANLQTGGSSGGYVGAVGLTGGIGSGAPSGGSYTLPGLQLAFNNTHVSGNPATTGLEMEIPLADLGILGGDVEVVADIDNGGLNYLSNQFLPGLPSGTGNLGTSTFSNAAYFTVPVPEPSSLALMAVSGLSALLMFRRRK